MTELARRLGLPSLTFYAIGLIVGAGIYTVIGAAAGVAGFAGHRRSKTSGLRARNPSAEEDAIQTSVNTSDKGFLRMSGTSQFGAAKPTGISRYGFS